MTSKRNQPVCMTSTPILHGFSYASPRNENQRLTCAMYISAGAAPSSAGAAPSSTPPQFGASNLPSPAQKRGSQFHLLAARLEDDEDRVKMEALQTPSHRHCEINIQSAKVVRIRRLESLGICSRFLGNSGEDTFGALCHHF